MQCQKCKGHINQEVLFCTECFLINQSYVFRDDKIQSDFKMKMKVLDEVLVKEVSSSDYLWDVSVARYATSIERAKSILESNEIKPQVTRKMFSDMEVLLKRCKSAEFHIALVGAIKAGKSTLINALLGYDLASTRVTPETASLTKFRRSSTGRDFVKVSFYTEAEWKKLWKSVNESKAKVFLEEYEELKAESIKNEWVNRETMTQECGSLDDLKTEIHKWTSSKEATHYFVKEVEVGLVDFDVPEGVIFVDTPGLDDVVAYRSNITRDYIDRANAVLVCVKSDSLTGPEMATIYSVFANTRYNPEKVYVIATQLDTLNRPEENWKEQRKEWLKYLTDEGAYGNVALAEKNLVPVSGYLYSLIQSNAEVAAGSDSYFDLMSILMKFRIRQEELGEHERRLMDFTGIDHLKRKLEKEVIDNHKALLVEDIKESYLVCKEEILRFAESVRQDQLEIINMSEKGIDEIRAEQKKHEIELKQIKIEKQKLEDALSQIERSTKERVQQLATQIKGLVVNK